MEEDAAAAAAAAAAAVAVAVGGYHVGSVIVGGEDTGDCVARGLETGADGVDCAEGDVEDNAGYEEDAGAREFSSIPLDVLVDAAGCCAAEPCA